MSEQGKPEFILWHRDRPGSVRVFADQAADYGDDLQLLSAGRRVAVVAPHAMAVNANAVVPGSACLGALAEPLPAKAFTSAEIRGRAAFWPFLSGVSLGFIGGFGLALSHAGLW